MMLIGFPGNRSNDLYKAIVLSVEIKKENDYRKIMNRKEVEGSWLRRKVRDISVSHFLARYGPVSCESLEQIAQDMRIKINIWTQKILKVLYSYILKSTTIYLVSKARVSQFPV